MSPLFFGMVADRVPVDAQYTRRVTHATAVKDEFDNLLLDKRIAGLIGVGSDKCPPAITAVKPLCARPGGAVAFNQVGFATMFARNRF